MQQRVRRPHVVTPGALQRQPTPRLRLEMRGGRRSPRMRARARGRAQRLPPPPPPAAAAEAATPWRAPPRATLFATTTGRGGIADTCTPVALYFVTSKTLPTRASSRWAAIEMITYQSIVPTRSSTCEY
eukprot:6205817-Pleurochrysis_carterae.AAC.1